MSITPSLKNALLLVVTMLSVALWSSPAAAQPVVSEHAAEQTIEHAAGLEPAGHAADAHGHGDAPKSGAMVPSVAEGIVPAVVALIVFSLVLAIASQVVWPKISKGLSEREHKIRSEIEGAEMARQQAKDALEQYQKSLADARAEANKMLEATRAQQAALAADLKATAEKDLAEMRDRARKDIEAAKRAAVAEMYDHASGLGAMIASKILKREVNAGDTSALIEESLRQLQASKN